MQLTHALAQALRAREKEAVQLDLACGALRRGLGRGEQTLAHALQVVLRERPRAALVLYILLEQSERDHLAVRAHVLRPTQDRRGIRVRRDLGQVASDFDFWIDAGLQAPI